MSTADVLRTEQVNLKLTPEELERLERLAQYLALSQQSVLRLLLKRASDEFEAAGRWPVEGGTKRRESTPPPKPRRR